MKATLEERDTLVGSSAASPSSSRSRSPSAAASAASPTPTRCSRAGADKVSVNSAALERPELITELAEKLGSQAVVVAIDADARATCARAPGRRDAARARSSGRARREERGAGEILLTSIDADGTREGYDLEITAAVADAVSVPVIASGGAGDARHVAEALEVAQAALLASILHEDPRGSSAARTSCATWGCRSVTPLRAADRPGRGDGPRADARVDGRRGRAADARDRRGVVLEPLARGLWHKGETSGNTLAVEELRDDCDGDALLVRVRPNGPACHTSSVSCFAPGLWRDVAERAKERPEGSY